MPRSPRRSSAAIPTGSMADIAFLMLVFFLVATSIRSDAGLPATLPSAGSDVRGVPTLLSVAVAADGRVLVDGAERSTETLRADVAVFAASVAAPHVALQTARATPYADYVAALDAVLLGHRDAGATPRLTLRDPAP